MNDLSATPIFSGVFGCRRAQQEVQCSISAVETLIYEMWERRRHWRYGAGDLVIDTANLDGATTIEDVITTGEPAAWARAGLNLRLVAMNALDKAYDSYHYISAAEAEARRALDILNFWASSVRSENDVRNHSCDLLSCYQAIDGARHAINGWITDMTPFNRALDVISIALRVCDATVPSLSPLPCSDKDFQLSGSINLVSDMFETECVLAA